jgi:hypothetical protein
MKPNILKWHLEMKHRSEEYNHRKLDELCIQQMCFVNNTTVPSKAPYQVSNRKAQNKKPT